MSILVDCTLYKNPEDREKKLRVLREYYAQNKEQIKQRRLGEIPRVRRTHKKRFRLD